MPTSFWWSRRSTTGRTWSDRGNPLLLGGDDEEDGVGPATPPGPSSQLAPPPPPRPLTLRALAAGFRATNAGLAVAGGAACVAAYALARSIAPIPPGPALIALASVGAASALTGGLAATTHTAASPRGLSNYSAALGAIVLVELIGAVALRASGRARLPPGLPAGHAPRAAVAVAALQVSGLALASLLGPVALRAEEDVMDAAAAAAADGWASPPRWGAASVGATPARPSASTSPAMTTPPPAMDGAAWRARMRDRYGLDTAATLTYDPERRAATLRGGGGAGELRGGGRGDAPGDEAGRRCALM